MSPLECRHDVLVVGAIQASFFLIGSEFDLNCGLRWILHNMSLFIIIFTKTVQCDNGLV